MTSLLYSAESWLTNKTKGIEKQYNKLIKCLLSVRKNTSINLCMVEAGIPPLYSVIENKRKCFMKSKRDRVDTDEPFHLVYQLCREANTPGFRFLERSIHNEIVNPMEKICDYIREKAASGSINEQLYYRLKPVYDSSPSL